MNKYCSIAWRVCESYKIAKLLALNTLYYVIKSSKCVHSQGILHAGRVVHLWA